VFVIDNILISDDLVDAPFTCDLGACHGACCVKGDSGAPLEEDEIAEIEAVVSIVEHRLRPEAREVIRHDGVWTESSPGQFAVACVGASECVFVYYEGPIAKCAIESAFEEGETDFRKPISCHLYPIRIEQLGDFEGLNYERMDMCKSGVRCGVHENLQLTDFLDGPLTRKYGPNWVKSLKEIIEHRRSVFSETL